ncbi:MAG: hypothetical protein HC845_00955 [Akkermansiaceae bacterium]|nr:hypothetical protein [Akkermansiaceae bacterium]
MQVPLMRLTLIAAVSMMVLLGNAHAKPPEVAQIPRAIPVDEEPPQLAAAAARIAEKMIDGIAFQGVAFDSRTHRLVVADQARGPESQYADSAAACRAFGGIAAVNAGFFTPEGNPLGLVAAAGKIAGAWNSASSLGSGVWYQRASGVSGISRREKLGKLRRARCGK